MRRATAVCLACCASWMLASPTTGSESACRPPIQILALDLSLLRHEFDDLGWQRSFYVHLDDTYASFVTGQLNRLACGESMGLVPEFRDQADQLDSDAFFRYNVHMRGGWTPVGWDQGPGGEELLVMVRDVR